MICATSKGSDQPAHTRSLCKSLEYSMIVKLPTEHHLEFLSLKTGCKDSSESTLVKMPNCRKSHVAAHLLSCHTAVSVCILVPWDGLQCVMRYFLIMLTYFLREMLLRRQTINSN